jgi:hypothetical protein
MAMGIYLALFVEKLLTWLLVLNPKEKMAYFKRHWSTELQEDVRQCVVEVVCDFQNIPAAISHSYWLLSLSLRNNIYY